MRVKNKRGDFDIDEVVGWGIAIVFFALLVFAAIILYKGKGGAILDSIKNLLRFGR